MPGATTVEVPHEEDMEMERDATPPDLTKKKKVVSNLPRFEEMISGFENRLKKHFAVSKEHVGGVPTNNVLTPMFITKIAVPVFFFTMLATGYLGVFVVMPRLKEKDDPSVLTFHRWMICLMFVEMLANWLCLRYVDNSYAGYLRARWKKRSSIRETAKNDTADSAASYGAGAHAGSEGCESTNGYPCSMNSQERTETRILMGDSHLPRAEEQRSELGANGVTLSSTSSPSPTPLSSSSAFPPAEVLPPPSRPPWLPPFRPNPGQRSYPYWSWTPCYVCEIVRPPRCHHCPLCQVCVLKRDHHCFFAGSCVGWRNQRYFLTFSLWACVACCYATANSYPFFCAELWPHLRGCDILFPVAVVRCALGYISGFNALYVTVQSLLLYFILLTASFAYEHCSLIVKGKTSFEVASLKKNLELRDVRSLPAKIRAVLGSWWLVNLLLPLHWLLEAEEDPEQWPSVKVYRH